MGDAGALVAVAAEDALHLAAALQAYRLRARPNGVEVPPSLTALESWATTAAFRRQSTPILAEPLSDRQSEPHDDLLISYSDAAKMLGVSGRTLSRMVAAEVLQPVGRRLRRTDVVRLASEGSTSWS